MPEEPKAVARGLSYAMSEKILAALIRNALKNAFAGTPTAVAIAAALRHEGSFGAKSPVNPTTCDATSTCGNTVLGHEGKVGELLSVPLAELRDGDEPPGALLLETALAECDALALQETSEGDLWPVTTSTGFICPHLQSVLSDTDASTLLASAWAHCTRLIGLLVPCWPELPGPPGPESPSDTFLESHTCAEESEPQCPTK